MEIKSLLNNYIYWPEIDVPYNKGIDFSHTSMVDFSSILEKNLNNNDKIVSHEIIKFYGLNETLSKIRQDSNEILDNRAIELYKTYIDEVNTQSQTMFSYIFSICVTETRHCRAFSKIQEIEERYKHDNNYFGNDEKCEEIKNRYKESAKEYMKEMVLQYKEYDSSIDVEKLSLFFEYMLEIKRIGYGRNEITNKFLEIFKNNEDESNFTVGEILNFCRVLFSYNDYHGGYGGEPWEKITKHGLDFATGKINAEVFIDQSFSLEHNGGQIFNKETIYDSNIESHHWSTQQIAQYKEKRLYRVLETQFLLNLQHKGYLLSFIKANFDSTELDNIYEKSEELYDKLNSIYNLEGLINKFEMPDILETIHGNIHNLKRIQQKFISHNTAFTAIINAYPISTPTFNFAKAIEGAKQDREQVEIPTTHYLYHEILSSFIRGKKPTEKNDITNYSFSFDLLNINDVPHEKNNKLFLGNKAYGLVDMTQNNLPVPAASVFPTNNAASYFNERTKWLTKLRPNLSKIINDFRNSDYMVHPFSVRSGSSISMPGMMDTILNVGIDDTNYDYLCDKMGKSVVDECVNKFIKLFVKSKLQEDIELSGNLAKNLFKFRVLLDKHNITQNYDNKFPLNSKQQLRHCVEAVFNSWNSERAIAYRDFHNIPNDIGTAAIVQKMVFGNLNDNSCTGVLFSRDCISGKKGIIGEFLPKAQGEDVVSGTVTPLNISELKAFNPAAYKQLVDIAENLEKNTGDIQDIEFTIEDGKLYILQKRKAVCSSIAQYKLNLELYEQGLIDKEALLNSMSVENLISKDSLDTTNAQELSNGLIGNPGIIRGIIIKNVEDMSLYSHLYDELKEDKNFGWIFVAKETSPEHAPIMLKTNAFITGNGGFTSHAAILARSWDKPCIVGIGEESIENLFSGTVVSIDAHTGKIYNNILPLKEEKESNIDNIVNDILTHYNINLNELEHLKNEKLDEINSLSFWTEDFISQKSLTKKETQDKKFDKFLNLGQQIAIMVLKERAKDLNSDKVTQNIKNISASHTILEINDEKKMGLF